MEFYTISLLNGISYGLLLFMLSSGLTLIFSMMGVLNFAHASFYMLGAYFAYSVTTLVRSTGQTREPGPLCGTGSGVKRRDHAGIAWSFTRYRY